MKTAPLLLLATLVAALPLGASAQVLFENDLSSGAGWSLVHEDDPSDNFATFGFDYSTFGIPEAPNTKPGDGATSGLQMIVNRDLERINSVAAFPTGMSFSGKYTYQFDLWMNCIGPFPLGGSGSTEMGGGAVGFDNTSTTPLSGASLLVTGEGGDSADWRLYAHDEAQAFSTHIDPETEVNDLYAPELPHANANANDYLGPIFPGKTAPAAQTDPNPPVPTNGLDQSGTLADGTIGFRWVTFKYTVDTDAGTAFVQATDAETDVTADIGTFTLDNTYVDRETIDTKLITTLEGNISLVYRDRFRSTLDYDFGAGIDLTPYSFGLFDNVIVEEFEIPDVLVGDYNGNNVVDAADFTVWRDTRGDSVVAGTGADGNNNGVIDDGDYDKWVENFGMSITPPSVAVPEPATLLLALAAGGCLACGRRRA
ncbi:hypothetical protein Mal64_14700 [Pseudobythopirellula maris]|uniref:PEP-CTERM protein-sorting domain-containing protein n=1 Tax=Pseudobythopirellula maris TaxID=2527991 RepID=A0A5C5ZVT5_9BACT|nr:PEP-CTERM sorting domain-containing protein [Pseudobythopirellula maris]TWT91071.1 hypothetical protein Mal64_14700 [Pseudobythopirellula maris]